MPEADGVFTTLREPAPDDFPALSAAVSPLWHAGILRLANVSERVCERLGWVLDHNQDNDPSSEYAKNCRELVDMLIEYLDGIDPDPDLEPWLGAGMFGGDDREGDDCELEDDDPKEEDGTAEPWLGWTADEAAAGTYANVHGFIGDFEGPEAA